MLQIFLLPEKINYSELFVAPAWAPTGTFWRYLVLVVVAKPLFLNFLSTVADANFADNTPFFVRLFVDHIPIFRSPKFGVANFTADLALPMAISLSTKKKKSFSTGKPTRPSSLDETLTLK
jgi:hypothetical protein